MSDQPRTRRTALITGASSGIGRAIAVALASPGWELLLLGRSQERLEEVLRAVEMRGATGECHPFDLASDAEREPFAEALRDRRLALDVLVHAAGVVRLGELSELLPEEFDLQYRVNLRAPVLLTRGLLSLLRDGAGQVVFINSGAGLSAQPGWSAYAASKFGLRAFADSLRAELQPRRIRVTTVYPGRTASPMQASVKRMEGLPYQPEDYLQPDQVASQVTALLRLPFPASVTELSVRPA